MEKVDIYERITNQIIEQLESVNIGDWQKPWLGGSQSLPSNVASGKRYQGANTVALWCASAVKGYDSATWGTYKQFAELGYTVRKGEKASHIVFWSPIKKEKIVDGKKKDDSFLFARSYAVFNSQQVDGFPVEEIVEPNLARQIETVDSFVFDTGARIVSEDNRAYYTPREDFINMPKASRFIDTDSSATNNYYSTLFHELSHWTGHKERLARTFSQAKKDYAFEELVAELSASFLCANFGLTQTPRVDHAQYIASWLQALKSDKRAIFNAASLAQKATNYLLQAEQVEQSIAA